MVAHLTKKEWSSTDDIIAQTAEGDKYQCEIEESFLANEEKLYLYKVPENSDKVVELKLRSFAPRSGEARIQILWYSTGLVYDEESPLTVLNECNLFDINNPLRIATKESVFQVFEVTAYSTLGIIRERDQAGATINPARSSGAINQAAGSRFYGPGTFFLLRVINDGTAQDINITYTWCDVPLEAFK